MLNSDQMMIDTQARIISKLNKSISELQQQNMKIENNHAMDKSNAAMYRKVVKMVQENPSLQLIWDDLVMTMRLIDSQQFK